MTTNQTIDGVQRELLERIVDPYRREPRAVHLHNADVAELRALLDAPAVERKPFGWWRVPKGLPLQGMFLHYDTEFGERDIQNALDHGFTVKRLYDTPAAQPQGEPVAHCLLRRNGSGEWVNDAKSWADGAPCREIVAECEKRPELYRVRLAYAEQPAPVAVQFTKPFIGGLDGTGQFTVQDESMSPVAVVLPERK